MSVFMGDNGRSFLTQPFIAIRVVEVPVSIDQMRDGIAAEAVGASRIRGRVPVIPASINTLPSAPVRTAILPPEPSRMLTLPRSLWTLMRALAASSRNASTILRASAKNAIAQLVDVLALDLARAATPPPRRRAT
jgi:hypothetical protein